MEAVASRPEVRRARDWLERFDDETLRWQRSIAAIPAPTGDERRRAEVVSERLGEMGLDSRRLDAAGNVIARRGTSGGTGVVVAAHLDTVFPADTDLTVRQLGPRYIAPGISDNARGLAGIVALAGAIRHAGITTTLPVTFVHVYHPELKRSVYQAARS